MATKANELNDKKLANELVTLIVNISKNGTPDNCHTFRNFAELLSLLPTSSYQKQDLEMIDIWMNGRFERDLVSLEVGKSLLPKFLESDDECGLEKALFVLRLLTQVKYKEDKVLNVNGEKPARYEAYSLVDTYQLEKIFENILGVFCQRASKETFMIFKTMTDAVFNPDKRGKSISFMRSAIEDHEQNKRKSNNIENLAVDSLRSSAEACLNNPIEEETLELVRDLFSGHAIFVRMGIYLLNTFWDKLSSLAECIINDDIFDVNYHHEIYHFLKNHFGHLTAEQQGFVINKILQEKDADSLHKLYWQKRWFAVISNQGNEQADKQNKELLGNSEIAGDIEHPDFLYYTSYRVESGFGPSPFEPDELLEKAKNDELISTLNTYEPTGGFRTPSIESLCETLKNVVSENSNLFIDKLPQFSEAKPPYQYAVLRGLETYRNKYKEDKKLQWNPFWESVLPFIKDLISDDSFWKVEEEPDDTWWDTPNKKWIPPVITDILESGTKKDSYSSPPDFLPLMLEINLKLLEKLEPEADVNSDSLNWAINSSRGQAIEALVNHALRVCRLEGTDHPNAWSALESIFQDELDKCKGTNLEFSTLSGIYIRQLGYMSIEWLEKSLKQIFPIEYPVNFNCALGGLAYADSPQWTYRLLQKNDLIIPALEQTDISKEARKRFVERIALAYLWKDEELNGEALSNIFTPSHFEDLIDILRFFFSIHQQELEDDAVPRIFDLMYVVFQNLDECHYTTEQNNALLSNMSDLYTYIPPEINERTYAYLEKTIPYAKGHQLYGILNVFEKLVEKHPTKIVKLFELIDLSKVTYDYQNRLENIIRKLAEMGYSSDAKSLCDNLRHDPKFFDIYNSLATND